MKKTPLIGLATDAQIATWKKEFPLDIFGVEKDERIAYFQQPGFKEMDAYHSLAQRSESVSDGWKAMAETLFIGGCKELIESPKYLPYVAKKIQEAMAGAEAVIVKL